MATKTSSTKTRQEIKSLNKQFPGGKGSVKSSVKMEDISKIENPAIDIANYRRERDANWDVEKADLSSFDWMLPCNRSKIAKDQANSLGGRFNFQKKKDREEFADLIRRSVDDKEVAKELAQYRQFEITSDLLTTPFALGAFQQFTLGADELPLLITPRARQHFAVRWIGQDGQARMDQWRTARQAETMEMRLLSTDKIEYSLRDLHEGDVNAFQNISAQLQFDLETKIDNLALEALLSGKKTSGLRALLNVHPDIDQNNIPDTNYLDLTDVPTYGPAGVFTLLRLKAILKHFALLTFGLTPDGPISMQTMIMSPLNAQDAWDFVDLVSGWDTSAETWASGSTGQFTDDPRLTVPTGLREQILNTGGLLNNAWGFKWQTQYNPRITKGRLYVLSNQPIGWYFSKPEWDQTITWDNDPDLLEQNLNMIVMRKFLNFFLPELWGYRFMIVDF